MREITVIDIGSGSIKAYNVDNEKNIVQFYKKTILFKLHFSEEYGISDDDKTELLQALKEIKSKSKSKEIYAYATSIFRMLKTEQAKVIKDEIYNETGIRLSILNQDQETKYIEKAVGDIPEIEEPYLVFCVGGGSTELIVLYRGEEKEHLTVEFAVGDILKKFPETKEDITSVKFDEIYKFIEENFKRLPSTKCKYAFFTGCHLTYNQVAGNIMEKNNFFYRKDIPKYISTEQYKLNTINTIEKRNLKELKDKYPQDPKFMDGARASVALITYILEKMGCEYIFPTDLNMINGIVNEITYRRV